VRGAAACHVSRVSCHVLTYVSNDTRGTMCVVVRSCVLLRCFTRICTTKREPLRQRRQPEPRFGDKSARRSRRRVCAGRQQTCVVRADPGGRRWSARSAAIGGGSATVPASSRRQVGDKLATVGDGRRRSARTTHHTSHMAAAYIFSRARAHPPPALRYREPRTACRRLRRHRTKVGRQEQEAGV
jgi:hypothetical protein